MTITILITLVILIICTKQITYAAILGGAGGANGLYDRLKDDVEILNVTSFETIYNCDRAVFVEFYAHWCGACQRYAQHWKELAKETKSWHSKVIRVAAINCADQVNDAMCREFNIEFYPTLKLFPAHSVKGVQPSSLRSEKLETLITKMILFIENHQHKPNTWPELEPYTSKRLDTLFLAPYQNCKFAFLIFEKSDSDEFGRKLILDFSEYTDRIAIRRIVSNPSLVNKLEVSTHLPAIYLVNNTHASGMKAYEKFDLKLIQKYSRNLKQSLDDIDGDQLLHDKDDRKKYSYLIRKFIKLTELVSNKELENLENNINAAEQHAHQLNREQAQSYLTNMDNRIFMQDLESGLHLMLRNDISRLKLITGDKMKALKEWLRILVKYFPGRLPVRNYLKQLYNQLNQSIELTGSQWKLLVEAESKPNSYLPTTVDWRHCLGSEEKYRGYPCSLWTLFHVLTVSQTESEKVKPRPFEDPSTFNLSEVIEAIRLFVFNFFTCKECADNFRMETENFVRYLSKPYDAVQYMWTIHNSVNKRLKNDESSDPLHPKSLFPSKVQCPKCYLPNVDVDKLADHESPWIKNEVLLFITSFYSKYQIEGIRELDQISSIYVSNKTQPIGIQDEPIQMKFEGAVTEASVAESGKEIKILSDRKISIIILLIVVALFVYLYVYFFFIKKKSKSKKHLV